MEWLKLLPIVGQIFDRVLPDKQAAEAAKLKLLELTQQGQLAELDSQTKIALAASDNVKTEAASSHWLAASWRPILMLTFGGLIVARFLGWTAEGISETEYVELWSIVKVGVGGYTVGRSAEKIVPAIVAAVKK